MVSWLRQTVIAFLSCVLIGASCGVLLILMWDPPTRAEDLIFLFVILFWATLASLPYVALGLALLGLPATWLLRRYFVKPWFGLIAAGWGAVAGSITYYWYDYARYGGNNELAELTGIRDIGPLFGIPTGLAWWLLYRRVLAPT